MRWDVFCHVVDNLGDIGVCWRLARQLADEHGLAVRLWVDDLMAFRRICPEIRADRPEQAARGVEIRRWEGDFAGVVPADVVVETFGCRLPEAFEAAMARREPRPVWVNLDHLSAEAWVAEYHGLPSPHPRLPITKYFFFPGFTGRTGGLLREKDLERERQAFVGDPGARARFLAGLGVPDEAPAETLTVSLFCYENAALGGLLDAWSRSVRPVRVLVPRTGGEGRREKGEGCVPPTPTRADIETLLLSPFPLHKTPRAGHLQLYPFPFLPQPEYDRLLWCCDLNFARGEDSFVRAQWAGRPMVWQPYAQAENAHHAKLAAFLDLHCAALPAPDAALLREFSLAWNGVGAMTRELWERWAARLPEWRRHAEAWREELSQGGDLCARLVQFCQSRL